MDEELEQTTQIVNDEEAKLEAQIQEWIEKGELLTYPERFAEWENFVRGNAMETVHNIPKMLQLMELLDSGCMYEDAKAAYNQENMFEDPEIMLAIFGFSKRGPEFFEYMDEGQFSSDLRMMLKERKKDNEILAKKHEND